MLGLALPANAHTRSELDTWVEDWETSADYGLSADLLTDMADMTARHPWYFDPQPTPSTRSVSSSTDRGMGSNVEQWHGLVSQYFTDVDTALCLIHYESGGNPDAKNPRSTARGLFQILASLWAPHFGVTYEQLYDPETNVRLAAQIYAQQGWGAWSPYNRGLCH